MANDDKPKPSGSIGRTVLAGLLFIVGLYGALSGLLAASVLAFQFFKMTMAHVPINPLAGRLMLAYGVMGCSGVAWVLAAYSCAIGQNRRTLFTVVLAVLLWSLFVPICPGPIPL